MPRDKIFYNIKESDYSVETDNFLFYFSSTYYMKNFVDRQKAHREQMKYMLSSRYNIEIDAVDYFDIILYSGIERRGFRITDKRNRGVYVCLKEITLSGEIKMMPNSTELLGTSMRK